MLVGFGCCLLLSDWIYDHAPSALTLACALVALVILAVLAVRTVFKKRGDLTRAAPLQTNDSDFHVG